MTLFSHSSPDILWFIPTGGDGRYLGSHLANRPTHFSYLSSVAQAADVLGFDGVLLPTGAQCEDAWVLASALASVTRQLRFLVAVRPGLITPVLAARMTATLDRLSNGRVSLNLVTGGGPRDLAAEGIFLDHAKRYELTREWLDIYKRLLSGDTVSHAGEHLRVEDAHLSFPTFQRPHPPLYFGGSSDEAVDVAAQSVDVYLTWGEPVDLAYEKITRVRERAEQFGRKVRFGLRAHIIVREQEDEAWQAAEDLIRELDDEVIAQAQARQAESDSVGQRRMRALHGGRRDSLRIAPNLWAGVGLVRGGAGTAFVGSGENVAKAIREYQDIGIDTFILSGYPHLEEAYRTAELLFPHLGKSSPVFPLPDHAAQYNPALPNVRGGSL